MAGLKNILKVLMPPIVIWVYRRLVNNKAQHVGRVFTGRFRSFDELRTNLKSGNNYYWPEAIEQELAAQTQRVSEWKSECPPSGSFRTNFLPTALSLFP